MKPPATGSAAAAGAGYVRSVFGCRFILDILWRVFLEVNSDPVFFLFRKHTLTESVPFVGCGDIEHPLAVLGLDAQQGVAVSIKP